MHGLKGIRCSLESQMDYTKAQIEAPMSVFDGDSQLCRQENWAEEYSVAPLSFPPAH